MQNLQGAGRSRDALVKLAQIPSEGCGLTSMLLPFMCMRLIMLPWVVTSVQ